jgi:hypothetical protein
VALHVPLETMPQAGAAVSYSFSKWKSIGLALWTFNVPGLVVGLLVGLAASWWLT